MRNGCSFFKQVIYSISNLSYYNNFKNFKLFKVLSFLCLIVLILGTVKGFTKSVSYVNNINKIKSDISNKKINLELKNGEINLSSSPYIIEKGENLIYIDTNIKCDDFNKKILTHYKFDKIPNILLIFKDKLVLQNDFKEIYQIDFKDIDKFTFGRNEVLNLLTILKFGCIFIMIYYISVTLFLFVISSLIVFLIGMLINLCFKTKITYSEIYKMSVYSLVLPSLLETMLFIIKIKVPCFYVMYIILALIYLTFAIKEIKNNYKINKFIR